MKPNDPSTRVSQETICAQLRGGFKAAMGEALRQAKPARRRERTILAGTLMVPVTLRIINCPKKSKPAAFLSIGKVI